MNNRRSLGAVATVGARARWLVVIALAVGSLGGCIRREDVQVRVTHVGGSGAGVLENVTVFVGGNKSSWPELAPDESVSVVLSPMGEPEITMTYTLSRVKRTWRGPHLSRGEGHAIGIRIAADGAVTERHCTRPCSPP